LVRSSECVDYQVRECPAEQHRSENRKACDNKWQQQQRIERHHDNRPCLRFLDRSIPDAKMLTKLRRIGVAEGQGVARLGLAALSLVIVVATYLNIPGGESETT
jgi:hypothetical protein